MSDFAFNRIRKYIGSGGEQVEVRPANEIYQGMNNRKWCYRFPKDLRWRISRDKFMALLESAWELGKSGEVMNWTPAPKKTYPSTARPAPRYGFIQTQLRRAREEAANDATD